MQKDYMWFFGYTEINRDHVFFEYLSGQIINYENMTNTLDFLRLGKHKYLIIIVMDMYGDEGSNLPHLSGCPSLPKSFNHKKFRINRYARKAKKFTQNISEMMEYKNSGKLNMSVNQQQQQQKNINWIC